MAALEEKQFELGGVVFGARSPVEVEVWTPGQASERTQDVEDSTTDGARPGRDLKGSATWSFTMYTNADDEEGAWAALAELAAVWDNVELRLQPGEVATLRYCVAGETRVVYGRPRRWTAMPTNLSLGGRIAIEADFVLMDPIIYGDELHTVQLDLTVPLELDAGLSVPFIAPFTTSAGSAEQQSEVVVGGERSTPIILTFEGPITDAAARIGPWTAALGEAVPDEDAVILDARSWVRSATRRSTGGGFRVSPRVTRLSKMWLPPGRHAVLFTGDDVSGSARLLVSWRDAYRTPR